MRTAIARDINTTTQRRALAHRSRDQSPDRSRSHQGQVGTPQYLLLENARRQSPATAGSVNLITPSPVNQPLVPSSDPISETTTVGQASEVAYSGDEHERSSHTTETTTLPRREAASSVESALPTTAGVGPGASAFKQTGAGSESDTTESASEDSPEPPAFAPGADAIVATEESSDPGDLDGSDSVSEATSGDGSSERDTSATGEIANPIGGGATAESAGDSDTSSAGGSDLVNFELAEHERWSGSFGEVGTAGSDERAQFLLDQVGQGALAGAEGGASMGFVMGAIGAGVGQIAGRRLATLAVSRGAAATPVPGLGSAIGGVMAVAGLAMRDWGAASETISRFGTGEGYEGLANDLEAIAEVLDIATQVMDVLAGVLGAIAVGMWVGAVLSAGALSPLAATLSAIALGINFATMAVGMIINVVIRPTITALRALHAIESQGDPAQIEAEGQQLQAAAGQITGAVTGAAFGKLGGAAGTRGGRRADSALTRLQARQTGGAPAMSATARSGPRLHAEVPEAPTRVDVESGTSSRGAPVDSGSTGSTALPSSVDGIVRSPADDSISSSTTHPPESFADFADVVADLNNSPEVATLLTDTRAPLQRRTQAWSKRRARRYANRQAAQYRTENGMTGSTVQAGHTAAARHARESGIREGDWDTQPMMPLHSRRGHDLEVSVTDTDSHGNTRTRTRTRHTAQEMIINDAVARSREAQGELTPQGQLDAAEYTRWATENLPWDQRNVDYVQNPPQDPQSGAMLPPPDMSPPTSTSSNTNVSSAAVVPSVSSPTPHSSTPSQPNVGYASHTETVRTADRSAAMAQYHDQVRTDPSRESGVWRDSDGNYYVMQGDQSSVAPPSASGPVVVFYHSHPTESGAARQGLVSQPSQAAGDLGVLQYQHGQGPAGRSQSSELHFPTYGADGAQSGYGTTQFGYEPTHPLPVVVETMLPGGRTSRQRYASFADFEQRTGIRAGGTTPEATRVAADVQLRQDVGAAQQRVDRIAEGTQTMSIGRVSMREGVESGRQNVMAGQPDENAPDRPELGPAYTTSVAGMQPGETVEIAINPAYPEPPGTVAELEALQIQADIAQSAQSELANTERLMNAQAGEQNIQNGQLAESQSVAEDLSSGRVSHQAALQETESANAEQKTTAEGAINSLGQSAQESTALVTLVGSLSAFRGMAHLFSYLPGSLGRSAETARNDAGKLINSLNRVSETDAVENSVVQGQGEIAANADRIQGISREGHETDEALSAGQGRIVELEQANSASFAETESTHEQAMQERLQAAASEEEATTNHVDLRTRLDGWAQEHRRVREEAIEAASSQLNEQGYRVTEEN